MGCGFGGAGPFLTLADATGTFCGAGVGLGGGLCWLWAGGAGGGRGAWRFFSALAGGLSAPPSKDSSELQGALGRSWGMCGAPGVTGAWEGASPRDKSEEEEV